MTGKALSSIALLALAACQPALERDAPEPTSSDSTAEPSAAPSLDEGGEPIASPEQLAGEYRVAGVGGEGIDLPYGISASITANTIHLTADCVNVEWGYVMDADGSLATLRVPTEGCARGLNPTEEALVEAFDGAENVSRNRANGYEFSGRGPTATLFTQ
jgi:hypothetical protein